MSIDAITKLEIRESTMRVEVVWNLNAAIDKISIQKSEM